MATVITIKSLLEDSGNLHKKQVDTLRLAQSLHNFIFQKGYVLEKKTEDWIRGNYLKALARSIESFGSAISEAVKTAYDLIFKALQENEKRTTRRPRRQKSSEQVALAA